MAKAFIATLAVVALYGTPASATCHVECDVKIVDAQCTPIDVLRAGSLFASISCEECCSIPCDYVDPSCDPATDPHVGGCSPISLDVSQITVVHGDKQQLVEGAWVDTSRTCSGSTLYRFDGLLQPAERHTVNVRSADVSGAQLDVDKTWKPDSGCAVAGRCAPTKTLGVWLLLVVAALLRRRATRATR